MLYNTELHLVLLVISLE